MTKYIGQLTSAGKLQISGLTRHEHHNIYVKVSSYSAIITIKIEDYTIAKITGDTTDTVNLNAQNESETITMDGVYSFLVENKQITDLQIDYVSGTGTLDIWYNGW